MCAVVLSILECGAQIRYDDYFTNDRMRLDMVMAGNAKTQSIWLESVNFEKDWSGTRTNLISPFDYGEYNYEVFDIKSGKKIFSLGFCTLFSEWRTTEEATRLDKAFAHSFRFPWPKAPVRVVFNERQFENGRMKAIASFDIDPSDLSINRGISNDFKVTAIQDKGPVDKKVDIVFMADGYTAEEMPKFISDVKRMTEYLFSIEPYKSRREDFNIWAVESISEDSGPDIPQDGIWKNTVVNSNFYTFYTDRYLTAGNQTTVARLSSNAPCDALYVIVNTSKYGGGGIYNSYALCASDSKWNQEVMIHEFGHSFAGLGDEYFDSEEPYDDNMYNLKVECWEPNITTMVDFDRKWKDMVGKDGVGIFEGGGYSVKNIFRPREDCKMRTNKIEDFCPVCRKAINQMIDYYCK